MSLRLYPKQYVAHATKATEILYGGAAGSGKSHLIRATAIIYSMEIPNLHVYIFRRTFKELISNHLHTSGGFLEMLHSLIKDGMVKFNKQDYVFEFKNGSRIQLAHAQWESDIYAYQGAQIPFLIVDEATHFTDKMLRFLRSRCRLGSLELPEQYEGMFPRILYASNPGGVGHVYLKKGFVNFGTRIHRAPPEDGGMIRQYVPARLADNKVLMENDPGYGDKLRGMGNSALVEAMLDGNWDIVDGGAVPAWSGMKNVCAPFDIPSTWSVKRGYDYGFSAPYAVLWVAISNGEEFKDRAGVTRWVPRGSMFIIRELYGADKFGQGIKEDPGDTAVKIRDIDSSMQSDVKPGPADNSIFSREHGPSIADLMEVEGITWTESNKKPGSRVLGLSILNQMVSASNQTRPEKPCFYVFSTCTYTIEQIPNLQMSKKHPEDVDTEGDDHIYDVIRYLVLESEQTAGNIKLLGK